MPLTEAMEKAATAERTAGPIGVFSNSYARLPEHFFARLSPTPVARPRLITFNESLASELRVASKHISSGKWLSYGSTSTTCRCGPIAIVRRIP